VVVSSGPGHTPDEADEADEADEPDEADEMGTLVREGDLSVLGFRRRLAHPAQKVWRALTDDAELAGWFPTTLEGERAAGAPLRFAFRQGEAEPFGGEMLAFEPPSRLVLRWGDDVLDFEVTPDAAGCVLDLTLTFPEHGKAARDAAGWHVCLERLAQVTAGGAEVPPPPGRWREVHAGYVARFGPEASVIGPPEGHPEAAGP
jgi:uncharacterized protein YndB with AHSA1/START domain